MNSVVSCDFWSPRRRSFIFTCSSCLSSVQAVKHDLPLGSFTSLCLFIAGLQRQMRLSPLHLGSLGSLWRLVSTCILAPSAPAATAASIHFSVHSPQEPPLLWFNPDQVRFPTRGVGLAAMTGSLTVLLNSLFFYWPKSAQWGFMDYVHGEQT